MRKIELKSMVLLIFIGSFGFAQNSDVVVSKPSLKVMSYNIWNGFDFGKDTIRKEKFITYMKDQAPDVAAFQELCAYTQEKLLKDAKKWGHNFAEIVKTSGYPVGITSNEPIIVVERILDNMHHGVLHCRTKGIDFMVVHFSPFSHKKRHEEANVILSKLAKIRKETNKYMVLGDFNAVSPFDANYYKGNEEMMTSFREAEKQHEHVRNLLNNELEYGAISAFLSFPLIDVVQKYTIGLAQRISCPTQVFEKQKGSGRHPNSTRVDYILTSQLLRNSCTNAWVCNGPDTFYLSDHYPVIAEFEL